MTEFQKYIQRYCDLIPSEGWQSALKSAKEETVSLFSGITEEKSRYSYAAGKWNVKELLQHLIDAEKIFAYRALRFARNDKTELPGWDEEKYAESYFCDQRSVESLVAEFEAVRQSSIFFFQSLNEGQLKQTGVANGHEISVETIGKLIAGHHIHHLNVLKERYLD